MNSLTQANELSIIHNEYKQYFPECDLLLKNDSIRKNHIRITTHEGTDILVFVDISGWSTTSYPKQYETFEALMMDISPGFRLKFGNSLTDRLNELMG